MANTTASLTNVNLLSKEQYDAIESPATDQLWAVECVVAGMPDYSAGVSVSVNTSFTPIKDGVIEYKAYVSTGTNAGFYIKENDSSGRVISGFTNAASGYIHQAQQLSVIKGKTYYVYATHATTEYITFYPYKGAI